MALMALMDTTVVLMFEVPIKKNLPKPVSGTRSRVLTKGGKCLNSLIDEQTLSTVGVVCSWDGSSKFIMDSKSHHEIAWPTPLTKKWGAIAPIKDTET
jgi:hypothetical protein